MVKILDRNRIMLANTSHPERKKVITHVHEEKNLKEKNVGGRCTESDAIPMFSRFFPVKICSPNS